MTILLQIDVGYAVGGVTIDLEEKRVVDCTPIFRADLYRRTLEYVEWWVAVRGGKITEFE